MLIYMNITATITLFIWPSIYASFRNIDGKPVCRRQQRQHRLWNSISEPKTSQTMCMLTYGKGSDSEKLVREVELKQSKNWKL